MEGHISSQYKTKYFGGNNCSLFSVDRTLRDDHLNHSGHLQPLCHHPHPHEACTVQTPRVKRATEYLKCVSSKPRLLQA